MDEVIFVIWKRCRVFTTSCQISDFIDSNPRGKLSL